MSSGPGEPRLWDPADAERSTVLLYFAGAGADNVSLARVRRETHDVLIRDVRSSATVRQAGPVEWRIYGAEAAPRMLEEAGLTDHPRSVGLLKFLRDNPGTVLVVASLATVPR